jgi:mannosyltransferase OCH1-like enzyme
MQVFLVALGCLYISVLGVQWKDPWIEDFEAKALKESEHCTKKENAPECALHIPGFIPARKPPSYTQKVPFAIWQTWKSNEAAGKHHYDAVMSIVNTNPEYDYYLFDDTAALDFMCTFYPDMALIYQQAVPGAVKADLWRLAVIFRYGGVYLDTDCHATAPLREIIWSNASVVSGIGILGDFHQWVLIYTPRHILIKTALKYAAFRLKRLYNTRTGGNIVETTGPGALHAAMQDAFQTHQCTLYNNHQLRSRHAHDEVLTISQPAACASKMGLMQIYNGDFLGNSIVFKDNAADAEKNRVSLYYGHVEHSYVNLFQQVGVYEMGLSTLKIGECLIERNESRQHWRRNFH